VSTPRHLRLTPRRRHLAAIVTIALSTAFLAVMILAGSVLSTLLTGGIQDRYAGADVVVTGTDSAPKVPGATAVWRSSSDSALELSADPDDASAPTAFVGTQTDPPEDVRPSELEKGHAATSEHEIVIDAAIAQTLNVDVGDTVTVPKDWNPADDGKALPLTVVGIAPSSPSVGTGMDGTVHVDQANQDALAPAIGDGVDTYFAALKDPSSAQDTADALMSTDEDIDARTAQDAIDTDSQMALQGFGALGMVLAVFVVIALLTSAVVISNTFAVTIAQRTRTLGLLRAVGASRSQVRSIVLRESAGVGALGAVIGTLLGHVLVQAVLLVARTTGAMPSAGLLPISVGSVLGPLAVGIAISVLAGLGPVRAATRVHPLEAMRPAAPTEDSRSLRGRGVIGAILLVIGLALLVGGVFLSSTGDDALGILLGILGGVISFVGVMIGLVAVTRPILGVLGALTGRIGGIPGKVAASNARRSPRRSAATIAALLIGTTLMSMMAVGARTMESSLVTELDSRKPIDAVVTADHLPDDAADQVADVTGVQKAEAEKRGDIDVGVEEPMTLMAATPDQVRDVSNLPGLADHLTDGTIVTGTDRAQQFGVHDGQVIHVTGPDGAEHDLTVKVFENLSLSVVTPDTFDQVVQKDSVRDAVIVKFAPKDSAERGTASAVTIGDDIRSTLETAGPGTSDSLAVDAGAVERESYGQILQVLLGITVGLLAVAVIVAVVGVANTLSLSVVERTGENALLRALGTTRRQMRAMLSWEGIMLSLAGSVLGIVLGSIYGVGGIAAILGSTAKISVTIPWGQLALVLVLSVLAGWAASVLPGNRAARTPPAQALAQADG
jgi:putative ABC transport system permease protein